jgi:hypothetical protein
MCSSGIDGDDVDTQQCFGWCSPIAADAHCEWCKVRGLVRPCSDRASRASSQALPVSLIPLPVDCTEQRAMLDSHRSRPNGRAGEVATANGGNPRHPVP